MPERILVTLSRPKDALALLDEIIALRAERDRAVLRALEYRLALTEALADRRQAPPLAARLAEVDEMRGAGVARLEG